ncbi:O-antigen ligase [Polaribacter sp. 20A6]|uniref:O-antigen ligase family protein n=1 Tax=Polaribacter sp. 20A6 TaxID=2687289 RepID=UPI0013FE1361|nr:hypothetical protein [Polaribacter sp. 20A6]
MSLDTGGGGRIGGGEVDDGINAVGLAYVNANLFFILFFIINQKYVKKVVKYILFLAILACLIIVVSSGSRGALIFTAFIVTLKYFSEIKSVLSVFSLFSKSILILIVVVSFYFFVSDYFPVLEQKVNATSKRFESMFAVVQTGSGDESVLEREKMYDSFYDNLDDFIILGKSEYKPYPHNIFMEVITRWGAILGIPFIFFLIKGLFESFKMLFDKKKNHPFYSLFIYCLFYCFLQSLSSLSLEMNRILWLSLGGIYGILLNKKK